MIMYVLAICGIVLMLWGIGMYIRMMCCENGEEESRRPIEGAGTNHECRNYLRTWMSTYGRRTATNGSGTNLTTSGNPDTAQENVWSVSREINAVYGPPPNYQWPTHNQHISVNSFSLTGAHQTIGSPPSAPTFNNTGGTKITPPPYSEVELPTYEEAITAEYQNHTYETIPSQIS